MEVLTEEQLSAYSLYMRTLGNRPDLFGQAQYPNASTIKQPIYYDIPPEALKDDKFAAMMEEATKYIGYPYVWGGSSPSTSFDCSGYISWVLNHSGWNVGRQTAPPTTATVWASSRCRSSCGKIRCVPQNFPPNKTKI